MVPSTNLAISRIVQLVEQSKPARQEEESPVRVRIREPIRKEMEVFNNILCVTVRELTGGEDGEVVMTYDNYKKLCLRNRLTVVRPGKGMDSYALVDWASIPERFKKKFITKYGDPEQKMREQDGILKYDQAAREFFTAYRLPDGKELKSEVQSEYVINASVLNRLIERYNRQRSCRNMAGNSTPISWDGIIAESERLRSQYGHTLPKNRARLQDKMRQYRSQGYQCLVSGKLTNINAVKLMPDGQRLAIALKRSRVPVYTNMQIFERYNELAMANGWKPLKSPATMTQFLNRPEVKIQWFDATNGELAAKQVYNRQNVTIMPDKRDSIWYGDGTKLNLFYKVYTPQGYKLATLQVFEVIDAYSECFIGYNISQTECFESMYEAYRMAIELTGHLPVELIYDNQGGTRREDAKEWLKKLATCSRPTAPYNAASKSIESIFGRFQRQVLHKYFGYTGGNITSKSESSRPNMEFIEANVNSLPTFEELCGIYAEARQEWNHMKHYKYDRPRVELYESSRNEESVVLTDALRRELFWVTSQKECKFTARGLQITINKQKYIYDVYGKDGYTDMSFRRDNTGRSFYVQYDPHDMSKVRLCTKDDYGYQCVAVGEPYMATHRAMQDQKEGERAFLFRMIDTNKLERVRRHINGLQLEMEHGVAPEQHGLVTPRPKGISDREYEYYADLIRTEQDGIHESCSTIPVAIGQQEKEISNMTFDEIKALDRM